HEPAVGQAVHGPDRARDDVAVRERRELVLAQLAARHEFAPQRMVGRELLERATRLPVHAGVTDVEHEPERHALVRHEHDARRGTAGTARGGRGDLGDPVVGIQQGVAHPGELAEHETPETLAEGIHDRRARAIARLVSTHPVGDDERGTLGEEGVLVRLASKSAVGHRGDIERHRTEGDRRHADAPSSTIDIATLPRMKRPVTGELAPRSSSVSVPSDATTTTPFVDSRSVMIQPSSPRSTRACTFESVRVVSGTARSCVPGAPPAGFRPSTTRSAVSGIAGPPSTCSTARMRGRRSTTIVSPNSSSSALSAGGGVAAAAFASAAGLAGAGRTVAGCGAADGACSAGAVIGTSGAGRTTGAGAGGADAAGAAGAAGAGGAGRTTGTAD